MTTKRVKATSTEVTSSGAIPTSGPNRYEDVQNNELGRGTFGTVFLKKDLLDPAPVKRLVAVKRIKAAEKFVDGVNWTALREIKILQEVRHENIIALLDVYTTSTNLHLVFEFCEYDLRKVILDDKIALRPGDVKAYMLMLFSGLEALHANWVLHRDLTPANLLMTASGVLKIGDFGLARVFASPNVEMTHQVVTLWYRAPELLFGSRFYGVGVDAWSAGCILGELLTGMPMFPGEGELDQLGRIFDKTGTPQEENWPEVSALPNYMEFTPVPPNHPPLRAMFSKLVPAFSSAVGLVEALLVLDPARRLDAKAALAHAYFTARDGVEPTPCAQLPKPSKDAGSRLVSRRSRTHHFPPAHSKMVLQLLIGLCVVADVVVASMLGYYKKTTYQDEESKYLLEIAAGVRLVTCLVFVFANKVTFVRRHDKFGTVAKNGKWAAFALVTLASGVFGFSIPRVGLEKHKWDGDTAAYILSLVFAVMECGLLYLLYAATNTISSDGDDDGEEDATGEKRCRRSSLSGKNKTKTVWSSTDAEAPLLTLDVLDEEPIEFEEDPDHGKGATMSRLVRLARPERGILFVATVALFVSSAATVVTPALFGRLIQTISVTKDEGELNRTTLLLVVFFVVSSVFALIRGALYTLAGERLVARFRTRLFDAVLHQDVAFFDKNQSGELQSRLASDTALIQNSVTVNISMSLRWVVNAIVSLAVIFYLSWKLTLIMLAVVPPLGVGARLYGTMIQKLTKAYQEALAKASETAEEAFGNLRTVRSFSKEDYEVRKYRRRIFTAYEYGKRRAWGYGFFIGGIGLAAYLAVALVLWIGGKMVIEDKGLSASGLTSFLLYTMNLAVSLGGLSELYSTLMSAVGASERMFALLDTVPTINTRPSTGGGISKSSSLSTVAAVTPVSEIQEENEEEVSGAVVRFEEVEFSYPSRPDVKVLSGMSFTCRRGTLTALVGPSGGGKTTVISLLERFYDPTGGRIIFDGRDLREYDPRELHSKVAIVSQEPALFATTIRENIAYGLHRPFTDEEVYQAARKANAYDFITAFPDQFDTLVGERGVQLSGGQKQRCAIARAILLNPDFLLLDEATSALDSTSEHLVQIALDELMKGRTTLVVAHRLSTVRDAHAILVVEGGKMVEAGTHAELIAMPNGLYASLVARQLS